MKIVIRRPNIHMVWLTIYIFISIFEPPILPISLIYIVGIFNLFQLFLMKRNHEFNIIEYRKTLKFLRFFLLLALYTLVISFIDGLFFTKVDLFSNRLKLLNQILVLTYIEISSVIVVLVKKKKYGFTISDIIEMCISAGMIQGILALLAYTIPTIRSLFLMFGDQTLYSNIYVIERRAYGFSMTLLDTFGYGMGLLAGLALFDTNISKIKKIFAIILIFFCIFINSRTGIVVFAIAIIIQMAISTRSKIVSILKIAVTIVIIYCLLQSFIPAIINIGIESSNVTVKWVVSALKEFLDLLLGRNNALTFENVSFLSNFDVLPTNIFEQIFGSGHTIYAMRNVLGFNSDVGYINAIWAYGILGTVVVEAFFLLLFIKAYRLTTGIMKKVVLFIAISYFIVQLKAILVGYNPGTMITYLVILTILEESKREKNDVF